MNTPQEEAERMAKAALDDYQMLLSVDKLYKDEVDASKQIKAEVERLKAENALLRDVARAAKDYSNPSCSGFIEHLAHCTALDAGLTALKKAGIEV